MKLLFFIHGDRIFAASLKSARIRSINIKREGRQVKLRNFSGASATLAFALIVLADSVAAQPSADVEGVKGASKAFFTALSLNVNGNSAPMNEVWAHTPYVTYVGPRSKAVVVGWDAVAKQWEKASERFTEINVTLSDQHIHVNGDLAWEMGQESGSLKRVDGKEGTIDYLVTNVYERIDGRWLMVSHHVQPKPQ